MGARVGADSLTGFDNKLKARAILALGTLSAGLYGILAGSGDLRQSIGLYLAVFAALLGLMFGAWTLMRAGGRAWGLVLGAALVFRVVAALGQPALSDDVYRYVWDGRVQLSGVHPYAHAPVDPALADLRDADWEKINHPELRTIYPPLAQLAFLVLAALGAGPLGFRLALGLADFAVVLALDRLLRRCRAPRHRLVLYAWNPLAVIETSGSGHVEPLGVLLMLLAALWVLDRRQALGTLALAASVHIKLVTAALLPGFWMRVGTRGLPLLGLALLLPLVPYALTGPALGAGLADYAERWEHNATFYVVAEDLMQRIDVGGKLKPLVSAAQGRWGDVPLPWTWLYQHVWPRDVARLLVATLGLLWVAGCVRRRLELSQENLLVLGGLLLLSPTLHPWYLLWVLPWAVVCGSAGWLVLAATISLSYLSGASGDVPWAVRVAEYLPPLGVALWFRLRRTGLW